MTAASTPRESRQVCDKLLDHAVARLKATRNHPAAACKVCGKTAEPFDVVDFRRAAPPPCTHKDWRPFSVSIYSRLSLQILAAQFGLRYAGMWPFRGTHLLTRGTSESVSRRRLVPAKLAKQARTLLQAWPTSLP